MTKVFITGGAGFIGSWLTNRLVDEGWEVIIFDNLTTGKLDWINKNAKFISGNVLDKEFMIKCLQSEKPDIVFHLAALADIRNNTTMDTKILVDQDFIATYNVLEAMRASGVKKIVFFSTSALYGERIDECGEDQPLIPISIYAALKIASEKLIISYCYSFSFQSWIFRPPNIVGGRGTHGVIHDFLGKLSKNKNELEILGDGKQEKSYMHVSDVVDAVLFALRKSNNVYNIFNLSTGDLINVTDLAKAMLDELELKDTKLKYTGGESNWIGDVKRIWLSNKKIKKLGWRARYNCEQSVRLSVREMRGEFGL